MATEIKLESLPIYKVVCGTRFVVDYFKEYVVDCEHFFLTHFHADHYSGLRKKFDKMIYFSTTTGNLLREVVGINEKYIFNMEMYKEYTIDEHCVLAIEANHCPGAISLIFKVDGDHILHCGDFRADKYLHYGYDLISSKECRYKNIPLKGNKKLSFDKIYIDNTYEGKESFKSQREIIFDLISTIKKTLKGRLLNQPSNKFIFTSYLIGKEKIVLSIAEYFKWNIKIDKKKLQYLSLYDEYTINELNMFVEHTLKEYEKIYGVHKINSLFTGRNTSSSTITPFDRFSLEDTSTNLILLSSSNISKDILRKRYLEYCISGTHFIIPSGHNSKRVEWGIKLKNVPGIQKVKLLYIPYSEHSSSNELELFKECVSCNEFINTVYWGRKDLF